MNKNKLYSNFCANLSYFKHIGFLILTDLGYLQLGVVDREREKKKKIN